MKKKTLRTFKNTAELLHKYRVTRDISQHDLSRQLGCKSAQSVSNMERGLCGIPTEKIYKLAGIFSVDPLVIIEAIAKDYVLFLNQSVKDSKEFSMSQDLPVIPRVNRKPTIYYPIHSGGM